MKNFILLFLLNISTKISIAQIDFNFFVSNNGNNANPGTTIRLPKKTVAGTANVLKKFSSSKGFGSLGLKSNNVFNESLVPAYSIKVGTYNDNISPDNNFAIFNGSNVFDSGWEKVNSSSNTYQKLIPYNFYGTNNNTIGNYSFIYVSEIDTELEKTAPFTARKILSLASNLSDVDSKPGSFFEPITIPGDSLIISIHTSDNISPNQHPKYRYEVTTLDCAVNAYSLKNNIFENLWVKGYGSGIGSLPGGFNSYYNKIIFGPGAAIHQVVIHNGTINNSLFLRDIKDYGTSSVIFYNVEGFLSHNKISNSIFLDIKNPVYTHTHATGTNYGALELDNIYAFADITERGNFVSCAQTDTISLNNIYTDNYTSAFNFCSAKYVTIKNSYFKDINNGIVLSPYGSKSDINNIFIRSTPDYFPQANNAIGIAMGKDNLLNLSNSTIHIKDNYMNMGGNQIFKFVDGCAKSNNNIVANENIFICDIDASKTLIAAATNTNNGIATSNDIWNNNVYILLRGKNIAWTVTNKASNNGSTTIQSFEDWKKQSGQDQNSLFFDLRNDPRGLKAIFIDPENGDYELANTVEGNKIKDLKAGMITPLTCFLKKPTYEEAAEMIRTGNLLQINSCRLKCQQARVSITDSSTSGNSLLCEGQGIIFQGISDFVQNDINYHQSNSTSRYLWWFSDETDAMGINLNSVDHKFSQEGTTSTRLQIVDNNGCSFDTSFTAVVQLSPIVILGNDTTVCIGSNLSLDARSNLTANDYLWNTGSRSNSITINKKGTYSVQATYKGCSSSDSIKVNFENCSCSYQMPTSFSPNSDGVNDYYKPFFECPPNTYSLTIFNRYGQLVFKTTDYKNSWNGFFDGKPLPMGTYVYILNFTNEKFKDNKPIKGSVTLLR